MQLAVENFHFCRCSRDFVFLLFQKFVLLADEQTAKSHSEQEQENDRQRNVEHAVGGSDVICIGIGNHLQFG
ncbi:Uncharacterised protein [Segatella copri]|nr:Uncharacterised protein [Segatella copri]